MQENTLLTSNILTTLVPWFDFTAFMADIHAMMCLKTYTCAQSLWQREDDFEVSANGRVYGAWTADLVVHYMVKSQSENWMPSNCEISQRHPNWWTNMTIVTERRWEGITVGCQGLWQYVKKWARSRSYKKKAKQSTNRVRRRPSNGPGLCKTAPTDLPSPQVPFWHILIQPSQNLQRKC